MSKYRMRTTAIHAGERPDSSTGASTPNIVLANSFVSDKPAGFSIDSFGDERPYVYTRWDNPTVEVLEQKIAALEDAEDCVCFASGMAATSAVLNANLNPGDHIVCSDIHYAGAAELIRSLKQTRNVDSTPIDTTHLQMVEQAMRPGATKLIWAETPSNPLLRIADLKAIADIASKYGAKVAVDSTIATPVATRPLNFGVDFVVHSLSKYIGGHGDAIGGAVAGSKENLKPLRVRERIHDGGVLSPFNAYLISRGATTLPMRMKFHSASAMKIAEFLVAHPRVTHVLYPGLADHPGHELAKRQMDCFSSLMSFGVRDGADLAQRIPQHVEIIHFAVSLGSYRSLLYWLPTEEMLSTAFLLDSRLADSYRAQAGEGIFRFAVGLEDPEDLCEELDRLLSI